MSVKVTNLIKFHTLLLLYQSPKYGYELIKGLEGKLGKKISASQIYPFLEQLRKSKYVAVEQRGKREKKVYKITKEGKKFVEILILKCSDIIEAVVEKKLKKCAHCGCEVYRGAVKRKGKYFCCDGCAKSF
ncbi:MAG: helix-turn-helix transcriptional regulator [Candidatus Woesearchaeota archaeon]